MIKISIALVSLLLANPLLCAVKARSSKYLPGQEGKLLHSIEALIHVGKFMIDNIRSTKIKTFSERSRLCFFVSRADLLPLEAP